MSNAFELQDVFEQIGSDKLLQIELPVLVRLHEHDFGIRTIDEPHFELSPGFMGRFDILKLQLGQGQHQQGELSPGERLAGLFRQVERGRARGDDAKPLDVVRPAA